LTTKRQTATQWGVFDITTDDGRITAASPTPLDPNPSPLGQSLVDGVQHRLRIERPSVRRGWLEDGPSTGGTSGRGHDEFVEVGWDEALDMAAAELDRVIKTYGNQAIYGGSYGWASAGRFHHASTQLHRFVNCIGGCTRSTNSYSTAAAQVILPHVVGPWQQMEIEQTRWSDIAAGSELVVSFGGFPLRNTQVAYGGITLHETEAGLREAVANGVRFVNIGPSANDCPEFAHAQWVPCRPGTDVALMLAIAFVLETESLVDAEFLDRCTVGYETFRSYILGDEDATPKTPTWAESITAVPAEAIAGLAREMAHRRTFLSAGWSLQRAHHGEQPYWMLVTLAAMLGYVGLAGGGFGFGHAAEGHIGSSGRRFAWPTVPKGVNATKTAIPVARIADMLLNPGQQISYNGRTITYPDIKLVYWAGGNPFHHHQDLNRLGEAWRLPETVIVHEPWWTPIARRADIVFPATTALEREDICASSHDPFAHAMYQVIEAEGEARSDYEILVGLSQRLGCEADFTEGRDERGWLRHLWNQSIDQAAAEGFELGSFDAFWSAGTVELPPPAPSRPWLADFRDDPETNRVPTPSGRIEIFSDRIAGFGYEDCQGHPMWFEPFERLGGAGSDRYQLHLVSHQPPNRLHSQLDHSAVSQGAKIGGREAVRIHPSTAERRGISNGDTVRLFNDRGQCLASASLDDQLMPEVVALPTGAWFDPFEIDSQSTIEMAGNPNVLTADIGTSSLAQGPSSSTCLVEIERFTGDAPRPRVYEPPRLSRQ